MDIQENLLEWALTATVEQRLEFLHKYLKVIPSSELDKVIKKAQAAKKRDRRNTVGNDKEKIQALKKKLNATTDDSLRAKILTEIKECEERRRDYEQSKTKPGQSTKAVLNVTPSGAQAVSSEAQAVPQESWHSFPMNSYVHGSCFEKYFPTKYVFLDCETVTMNNGTLECGYVALLDHNRKTIYKTHVFHPANSFKVNNFTRRVNGFNADSLCNSSYPKLDQVSENVERLISDKLVVLTGGEDGKKNSYNDLISLKLDASDITVYNLHFHFFKTTVEKRITLSMGDERTAFVFEPISLRRLCMKYFDVDIQSGIHDPEADAFYTAKIFQEILPLQLAPGLKNFVEYDTLNMCAYQERYVDFDDEPKMSALSSKIRAARKRPATKPN